MSEPFLPAHEPRREPDPREHDVDADVDVFVEAPHRKARHAARAEAEAERGSDDSAVTDAESTRAFEKGPRPPFRTPTAGAALTPEQLAAELAEESGADSKH